MTRDRQPPEALDRRPAARLISAAIPMTTTAPRMTQGQMTAESGSLADAGTLLGCAAGAGAVAVAVAVAVRVTVGPAAAGADALRVGSDVALRVGDELAVGLGDELAVRVGSELAVRVGEKLETGPVRLLPQAVTMQPAARIAAERKRLPDNRRMPIPLARLFVRERRGKGVAIRIQPGVRHCLTRQEGARPDRAMPASTRVTACPASQTG
jgi:hypothetical protein